LAFLFQRPRPLTALLDFSQAAQRKTDVLAIRQSSAQGDQPVTLPLDPAEQTL